MEPKPEAGDEDVIRRRSEQPKGSWYAGTYLYYYKKIDCSIPPPFLYNNRLDLNNNKGYRYL